MKFLSLILLSLFLFSAVYAEPLRFGIASTPSSGGDADFMYKDLNDYIAEKLGRDVTAVKEQDYDTMNTLIKKGEVDFAAACTTAISSMDKNRLRIIALPVIHGKISYRSLILVNKKYGIKDVEGLKGRTFAFTDRLTGSGALYPTYLIIDHFGVLPEKVLKKIYYTKSNERSIYLLNKGVVEAAAVDSEIFNRIRKKTPKETENISVIHKSPEMIAPPFVASAHLDDNTVRRLKNILLNMDNDPEGRLVLRELNIDKFVAAKQRDYQTITGIKKLIDSFGRKK